MLEISWQQTLGYRHRYIDLQLFALKYNHNVLVQEVIWTHLSRPPQVPVFGRTGLAEMEDAGHHYKTPKGSLCLGYLQ